MSVENQIRAATPAAAPPRSPRGRLRRIAGRGLLRVARPYARYRARQAGISAKLAALTADVEHVRERHTEQIERLEDLARELVLTAESLRREIARREHRDGD
jgi:hypothetical protein